MSFRLKQANNKPIKACYTSEGLLYGFYFLMLSFDFVAIASGVSVGRIAALITIVISLLGISRWRLRLDYVGWLIATFSFVCLCSLFMLPVGFAEYNSYFTIFLNVLIVVIACSFTFSVNDVRLWRRCLVVAALTLGVLAILSPGQVGTEWASGRVVPNIMGSQQDPNEFCGYYLLPVSMFTFLAFERRKPIYAIPIVFIFYTVLMTGSRGGLIAVAVAFAISLIAAARNDKHKVVICLAAIAILALLVIFFEPILALFPDSISSRFLGSGASADTAESRMSAWSQLLAAFSDSNILEQLFGHGFGTTVLANSNHIVAHNVYVELLYDVGLLGLGSFVGLFVSACAIAFRNHDYVLVAALLGEAVLLMTLSSFWSKTLWGILILAYVKIKDNGSPYER